MKTLLHIAFLLAAIILAALTLRTFGIADGSAITASLAVAAVLPWLVARRCQWWTRGCTIAYGVVALILVASAAHYIYSRTLACGHTLEMPALYSDAEKYYNWALHHYDGRCPEPLTTFFGFPLAMLALWRVLGVSVVWPVAMNTMLTLASILMAASLAVRYTRSTSMAPGTAAVLTIALLGLHGFFLSQGILILKEALIYFAITLIAISFARLDDDGATGRNVLCSVLLYTLALVILALVRAKYVNFAAIGLVLLALSRWRNQWRAIFSMALLTLGAWYMGMYCSTTYSVAQQVGNVVGGEYIAPSFDTGQGIQGSYLDAMDGYFTLPAWKRVLLLPFTSATQYIIPFPWGAGSYAWESVMPRLRLGWYLAGGLVLCYYILLSWRRGIRLGLVTWWPVVCWAAIAFISAGTVSRYILPFQPLLAAVAIYVLALAWHTRHRRPILIFTATYLILLTATLLLAHHLTT